MQRTVMKRPVSSKRFALAAALITALLAAAAPAATAADSPGRGGTTTPTVTPHVTVLPGQPGRRGHTPADSTWGG